MIALSKDKSYQRPIKRTTNRFIRSSPLGTTPSQQDLLSGQSQSIGNLRDGLINRSTLLTGKGDQTGVPFESDIMLILEIDQGLGRVGDVGVVQDLVDDGLDVGVLEENLEILDGETNRSVQWSGPGKRPAEKTDRAYLETPIDLTKPSFLSFSISFQVPVISPSQRRGWWIK
jgi:hypothetical protein